MHRDNTPNEFSVQENTKLKQMAHRIYDVCLFSMQEESG